MVQCVSRKLRWGRRVSESFKINHKTYLRVCMSIGYLEPIVYIHKIDIYNLVGKIGIYLP